MEDGGREHEAQLTLRVQSVDVAFSRIKARQSVGHCVQLVCCTLKPCPGVGSGYSSAVEKTRCRFC